VAVASGGYIHIICTWLQTDNHTSTFVSDIAVFVLKGTLNSNQTTPAPHHSVFLQAGSSSWCPTNSVKALKASQSKTENARGFLSLASAFDSVRCWCLCRVSAVVVSRWSANTDQVGLFWSVDDTNGANVWHVAHDTAFHWWQHRSTNGAGSYILGL